MMLSCANAPSSCHRTIMLKGSDTNNSCAVLCHAVLCRVTCQPPPPSLFPPPGTLSGCHQCCWSASRASGRLLAPTNSRCHPTCPLQQQQSYRRQWTVSTTNTLDLRVHKHTHAHTHPASLVTCTHTHAHMCTLTNTHVYSASQVSCYAACGCPDFRTCCVPLSYCQHHWFDPILTTPHHHTHDHTTTPHALVMLLLCLLLLLLLCLLLLLLLCLLSPRALGAGVGGITARLVDTFCQAVDTLTQVRRQYMTCTAWQHMTSTSWQYVFHVTSCHA